MAKKQKANDDADGEKLARLRAQLPAVTGGSAYFNAGSNGPIPLASYRALTAAAEVELERGRIAPGQYEGLADDARRVRALIASLFGADPAEIALMRSTSEGLSVALMGLTWRPGDEVITTQLEHICLFSPLALLAHRHDVVIRTIDIGNGGGDVVGALRAALSPRTRAIAISHVQSQTGAVMPIAEIAAMARERGILTIVDAAQGPGHVPVDLHALGVDAYAMAGQKWLGGPDGTGALFVRKDRLGDIRPTYLRYGAFDPHGFVVPPPGAMRYESGEGYGPVLRAQEAGLLWLRDEVGLDWALARIAALGHRLARALGKIDGVEIATPLDRMAGFVSFTVQGMTVQAVRDAILTRRYTLRAVDQRPGPAVVRASTGWWCTEAEIDGLAGAVNEVAKGARASRVEGA